MPEGALLVSYGSGEKKYMHTPEKILVRMPNWVGDLVMATPVLADLRKAFPKALITAMCRKHLADLLEKEEAIDELFCFEKPSNSFSRREDLKNIVGKIQAGKYDTGILLTHSFSSAWWFWLGKVQRRIGFRSFFRQFFLTDAISFPIEKEHQVMTYKRLLAPLGIPISQTAPRLFFDEKEKKQALQLLMQHGWTQGKKWIGINPGAAYGSAKCWPPERFRALAMRLLLETEAWIVFFGDAKTWELVKEICRNLPNRVIDLAGITSLKELICLIDECSLFITNDSGPMHIAAALKKPLIALFGSTDEKKTGPYDAKEAVIRKKVGCSPCFQKKCPIDFSCMKQISVDEVVEKALEYV